MSRIATLGRKPSSFDYEGNVDTGTRLLFAGKPFITPELYQAALKNFSGQVVPAGVSMTDPTPGGFGEWLQKNSSKYGRTLTPRHGSFVAAVLFHEGYIKKSIRRNAIFLHFPVYKERRPTSALDMDFIQQIEPSATLNDADMLKSEKDLLSEIVNFERKRQKTRQEMKSRGLNERFFNTSLLFVGDKELGKTHAAEILADKLDLPLYRIDLSQVVSKYIGETEKNLRKVFDAAEEGGAILFFNEADALFGKRSEVRDSHDRYANIEIGYLLQRMESYRGLAILATNMKEALEPAFTRRIRFVVNFPCVGHESEEWEMKIDELQQKNGIWFHNRSLIREAMTHSTYVNEHLDEGLRDNLRLALLGDAICNFIVCDYLLQHYSEKNVGAITDLRSKLVKKKTLAEIAKNIGLDEVLRLGKGEEKKKGRTNLKNLHTAIEAFTGSLYMDQGLERVISFLIPRLATFLGNS